MQPTGPQGRVVAVAVPNRPFPIAAVCRTQERHVDQMGLTKFAISRRVTIAMLISILLVLGAVGLSDMPWELFPSVEIPIITVVVPYPGAGPEEIEQRVLKPLEDECAIVEGVQVVQGYARQTGHAVMGRPV